MTLHKEYIKDAYSSTDGKPRPIHISLGILMQILTHSCRETCKRVIMWHLIRITAVLLKSASKDRRKKMIFFYPVPDFLSNFEIYG